jgi:membrane protein required for colicin V production
MSVLDIICIAVLALAAIRCAFRGFVTEIMSMAALILGIVAAVFFSKAGAVLIDSYIGYSNWNQIVAFLVLFIVVYLVVKLVERLLHNILDRIRLERLDHAMGFFLGLLEGAIIVVLLVYLIRVQPVFDASAALDSSFFARMVLEIVPIFVPAGAVVPAGADV